MDLRTLTRILSKALTWFVAFNALFAWANTPSNAGVAALGQLSLYNVLWPGRLRLPYGDDPDRAYNLSLYSLEAMFASHVVSRPADEFRVFLIGDSATWGWLLRNEDTLAGQLNALGLRASDGRAVRVYNLGYPIMSLTKDLLILRHALRYQPSLVVWLVTLESFPSAAQLDHPIVRNNAPAVRALINAHHLRADPDDPRFVTPTLLERTIVGQRRALADWLRLQAYGALWGATGIDQYYPETFEPAQRDFDADLRFKQFAPPELPKSALAFDALDAGVRMVTEAGIPVLIVNEPILVSQGRNSHLRYNFLYPRWAYDAYRDLLRAHLAQREVAYIDAWNAVPQEEFTNSAVHLTPRGTRLLAGALAPALSALAKQR